MLRKNPAGRLLRKWTGPKGKFLAEASRVYISSTTGTLVANPVRTLVVITEGRVASGDCVTSPEGELFLCTLPDSNSASRNLRIYKVTDQLSWERPVSVVNAVTGITSVTNEYTLVEQINACRIDMSEFSDSIRIDRELVYWVTSKKPELKDLLGGAYLVRKVVPLGELWRVETSV